MHPNALLELATELLHRVLQLQHPADNVVSDFFRQHRALGIRERHTLAETTYAVLRQRLLYEHLAQSGKGELERRLAVLAWQGNAGFLRAALSETEQLWLHKSNAVDRAALADKLRHNLPDWLAETLPSRSKRASPKTSRWRRSTHAVAGPDSVPMARSTSTSTATSAAV